MNLSASFFLICLGVASMVEIVSCTSWPNNQKRFADAATQTDFIRSTEGEKKISTAQKSTQTSNRTNNKPIINQYETRAFVQASHHVSNNVGTPETPQTNRTEKHFAVEGNFPFQMD